ncbi:hypothetical protein DFH08DRAFT_847240 [Mycena albidolilacea]|uniref:Uncharacterized protein n=1 Tax=Mycena albidolilacea TaxID=1033008 RepID=A0AAD7AIZ6_9AGAR|nr:hypothetical protein DFH08DRAFT_847240 [Mycena albidolilacea]
MTCGQRYSNRQLRANMPYQPRADPGMSKGTIVLSVLVALFFIRYLLDVRSRRRIPFIGMGTALGGGPSSPLPPSSARDADLKQSSSAPSSTSNPSTKPTPTPADPSPAPALSLNPNFSAASTAPEENLAPAARQAYLAAELRAAQASLERGTKKLGGGMKGRQVRATKARISELEGRQMSAWALGLESGKE